MMSDPDAVLSEVRLLRGDVQDLTSALRRSRWYVRVLSGVCAGLLLVSGLLGYNFQATRGQAQCVRSWANAYASRTSVLVPANTAKNKALDDMLRSLALPDGQRKAKFQAAFVLYLRASDTYNELADQNPPPTAPQYTC